MNDDLISRQAVLDALKNKWNGMITELFRLIKELPAAEPSVVTMKLDVDKEMLKKAMEEAELTLVAEPRKGKWIIQSDTYHEYWECDQCGMGVGLDDVRNYCPNCGARMTEESE